MADGTEGCRMSNSGGLTFRSTSSRSRIPASAATQDIDGIRRRVGWTCEPGLKRLHGEPGLHSRLQRRCNWIPFSGHCSARR